MKISTSKKNKKFFLLFEGKKIPITQSISIGSKEGDLIIQDQEIAKKHCTFYPEGQSITLIDHNSQTGTFIGQIRIHPERKVFLVDRDIIRIGNTVLEIKTEEGNSERNFNQIYQQATPEKVLSSTELAGSLSRFLALCVDLSLVYFVKDFIPDLFVEKFSYISFIEKNKELIHFFSLFIIFQTIVTLFLKVTLGQYLFNFSSKSRIKSILRNIIGIITLPFLVFDLPLLFQHKSFKEYLTTPLEQEKIFSLFGYLIAFILLPFFFYLEPLKDISSSQYKTSIHKEDYSNASSSAVNYFHLKFFDPLKVYPFFDKVEYSKTNAAIRVIKDTDQIKISFTKNIPLKEMIKNIKLYPFFLRGFEKNFFYLQPDNFQENFLKVIIRTLKLDLFTGFFSFKDYFPYYKHLLDFKKVLLTIFETDMLEDITFSRFNNNLYMIIKKDFYYFLPLRLENTILYSTDCSDFKQLSSFLSLIDYGQDQSAFFPIDYFLDQKKSIQDMNNYYSSIKKTIDSLFFETLKSEILLLARETKDKELEGMILNL